VALVATGCGSSSKSTSSTTAGGSSTSSGGSSGNTASAPGVTATTIKVGFITSATGNASSTFTDSETGAKAAFEAINRAGGINGRTIQIVAADDQSSAQGDATATQDLLNQGVFMIENYSPYAFGGYRLAQQAGVPIVGGAFDGPEWGQQPNTNMFSYLGGVPSNGNTSENTEIANFFKLVGASNIGGLAYGVSPSSISSIQVMKTALEKEGLKMGYENLSVPFGGVDVTSYVLAMKAAGVDGAACSCVQSTNLALFTGLQQGGVNAKAKLSLSSADSSLFDSPTAAAAAQGAYYPTLVPPLDLNNPATNTFLANVKAVDPSLKDGYTPSYGLTGAYLAAEVGIKGLQVAGQNPTRESFIKNLTQVTGFTAGGLLASPVSYNHFGTAEQTVCSYFVQVTGNTFKTINNGKPICGNSF
jgi:branched-chain amino acid transport system substrate-binding protein